MRRRGANNNVKRKIQTRSLSVQQEHVPGLNQPPAITSQPLSSASLHESVRQHLLASANQAIDINVIQPTPNISPSTSLNGEDGTNIPTDAMEAGGKKRAVRRVSFSEDETSVLEAEMATGGATPSTPGSPTPRRPSLVNSQRQMTVPMSAKATMSYLQVRSKPRRLLV